MTWTDCLWNVFNCR